MNNQKQETSMKRAIMMNMFWALFSLLINTLMNFLITPYVTNNIGVEAYGFVALANTFISCVDWISVSLNAYAGRFISVAYHKGQKEEANRYFSSTIVADAVLGGMVFLLGIAMILKITWFCKIPQELVPDVKRLFFLVLLRYIMVVMRTAFETAAFIADRYNRTAAKRSLSFAGRDPAFCMPKLVPARMVCGTGIYVSGAVFTVGKCSCQPETSAGSALWAG